jgi:hypothetical protein
MSRPCPRCGNPAFRIPRRAFDRVISLVRPVQRYQCSALECQWCGNLPRKSLPGVEHAMTATNLTATH